MSLFKSKKFFIYVLLIIILFIRTVYSIYLYNYKYRYNDYRYVEVKIDSIYTLSDKYISYLAKVKYSDRYLDRVIVYIENSNDLELTKGDIISFYSKLSENKYYNNYNEFNYKHYLNSNRIVGTFFASTYNVVRDASISKGYKEEFEEYLDGVYNEQVSSTVKAIMYGDKSNISDDISSKFNEAGISHILVVSGTAIYILRTFLYKIFKKAKYRNVITLAIVTLYVIFCNFSVSIFRAYLMFVLGMVYRKLKFNFSWQEVMLQCFIILLIINPYYIFSYSIWYSFLAALGIRAIYPMINSKSYNFLLACFRVKHKRYVKKRHIFNILKYIFSMFSLTISVQLMLFPIIFFSCNKVYLITIISNLIINVISVLEYVFGFILIITFKVPIISTVISKILGFLTLLIIKLTEIFSKLSFLNISVNKISLACLISIYIAIFLLRYGYIVWFKLKYKLKSRVFKVVKYGVYVVVISIITIDVIYSNFAGFVYYFNVGQGNMAITKYDNLVIISDIGSSSCKVESMLLSFLKAYRVNKIDYIFLSHMHEDHINGLYQLEEELARKNIVIKNVVLAYVNKDIKDFCSRFGINIIQVQRGDILTLSKKVTVKVLSPDMSKYIRASDSENANSLVYSIDINGKKLLFTGDATKETEEDVICSGNLDYKFYVLQVAHHGSSTSSSEYFFENFSFEKAVISSEKKMYNHPSDDTIYNLQRFKIIYYLLEKVGGKRFNIY